MAALKKITIFTKKFLFIYLIKNFQINYFINLTRLATKIFDKLHVLHRYNLIDRIVCE